MKIIFLGIIPLLILAILSVVFGSDMNSISIVYYKWDNVDLDLDKKTMEFDISDIEAGIVILITILAIVAIMGINILGSGLTGESTRIITILILYIGIWSILSILAWDLLFENVMIGSIIYIFLALFFVIGTANMLTSGG